MIWSAFDSYGYTLVQVQVHHTSRLEGTIVSPTSKCIVIMRVVAQSTWNHYIGAYNFYHILYTYILILRCYQKLSKTRILGARWWDKSMLRVQEWVWSSPCYSSLQGLRSRCLWGMLPRPATCRVPRLGLSC